MSLTTNLQSKVFEAFRSIEIPEDKAIKAAAALANGDDDVISLRSDMQLVKWMVGFLLAVQLAVLFRLFAH